jgi:hypothetical protein
MTDNEIIKALECCYGNKVNCNECPMWEYEGDCFEGLMKHNALSLINRQKAEIERLHEEVDKQYEIAEANVRAEIASGGTSCHWCEDKVRAEAIKEFAERLKSKFDPYDADYYCYAFVDDVVKEMGVGDNA